MKVFLDTNVLVSALTARGLCADLLRYLLAEHEVLTGEVNVVELRRVLKDRFGAAPNQVALVEALVRDQTIIAKPRAPSPVRVRDPADAWVLASAISGGAAILVTGDQDLLTISANSPIPILTPRDTWARLRGDPGGAA